MPARPKVWVQDSKLIVIPNARKAERTRRSIRVKQTKLMSVSCHLYRASNVEIGFECQIFVIASFIKCSQVLQFGAHSRYYKGALTQKRSFLVICITLRSDFHVGCKKSKQTMKWKWHDPHIKETNRNFVSLKKNTIY